MRIRGTAAWCGLVAVATTAGAAPVPPPPAPSCVAVREQLFLSPMGEPFRAAASAAAPVASWFAGADKNGDGRLTQAEAIADADRFFVRLDLDRNGEIAPVEISDYENRVAPEIRLYQSSGFPGARPPAKAERRSAAKGGRDSGGEIGAGRFAWLNIPQPVAAADLDFNRGISAAEFRSAAAARFRLLDGKGAQALTLATLPPLPPRPSECPPVDSRRRRR
ncbi:MAG: hypothetical protein JWM75_631 [Sphingomonas bacterium]|nr:hypothetical protein [Sphingomonas bacterium]